MYSRRTSNVLLVQVAANSTLESGSNTVNQNLVVKRLREKLHSACSHCLKTQLLIAVRRDEDGRNLAAFSDQFGLQFQAGHPWHPDVGNQACALVLNSGVQEFFSRRISSRRESYGFQETLNCRA